MNIAAYSLPGDDDRIFFTVNGKPVGYLHKVDGLKLVKVLEDLVKEKKEPEKKELEK
jgi:hypothetical protein